MHSIDVLVVRCEPKIILHIALRLEVTWWYYFAHAKLFSLFANSLNITEWIPELSLCRPKYRCLKD